MSMVCGFKSGTKSCSCTRGVLIADVGGQAVRLFFFQEVDQSLKQRQSPPLEKTSDFDICFLPVALDQTIVLKPKVPRCQSLDRQAKLS